jgi:hypothetical protein
MCTHSFSTRQKCPKRRISAVFLLRKHGRAARAAAFSFVIAARMKMRGFAEQQRRYCVNED